MTVPRATSNKRLCLITLLHVILLEWQKNGLISVTMNTKNALGQIRLSYLQGSSGFRHLEL
jgi:hypothetical protein